jgi:hypothetical protein
MEMSEMWGWVIFLLSCVIVVGCIYNSQKEKDTTFRKMTQRKQLINQAINDLSLNINKKLESINLDCVLFVDINKKIVTFIIPNLTERKYENKSYGCKDLLESHIVENGSSVSSVSSVNRGSQIGGALIGGLLAGGVGAVIGGLSGSSTIEDEIDKMELVIVVNDIDNPVFRLTLLTKIKDIYSVKKNTKEYQDVRKKAEYWHHLISVLIHQADEEDKIASKKGVTN